MPQKTNQHGLDLDSALDTYSAQAKSLKRPSFAHAAAYTAAAGAALALAPSADAAIYNYVGQYFSLGTGTGTGATTCKIDFDGDTFYDFSIAIQHFVDTTQGVFAFGKPVIHSGSYPARLASGQSVGPAQAFAIPLSSSLRWATSIGLSTTFFGNWTDSQQGFLGIAIPNAGSTNYAWVRLSVSNDVNGIPIGFAVQDWAYENVANTAIVTGVIPEPSPAAGLALLAAGAVGVSAWRRRKQPKA